MRSPRLVKRDKVFRCVSHMLGSDQVTTVCQIKPITRTGLTLCTVQSLRTSVKYVGGIPINIITQQNIHHLRTVFFKCTVVQALRLCTDRTAHRGSRGIALL